MLFDMYFWRFFNMSLTPQDAKKKAENTEENREKTGKKGGEEKRKIQDI